MKTAAVALAFFTAALAAPLEKRHNTTQPFTLDLSFSNTPELTGPINANAGSFWVGKETQTSCPSSIGSSCPAGNITSFVSDASGALSLNTEVPGGQQVYIAPNGLLSYTIAHSANLPTGAITSGLVVNATNNQFNKFYTYQLCNTDADSSVWQVWLEFRDDQGSVVNSGLTGTNACYRINLLASDIATGASAWEYA